MDFIAGYEIMSEPRVRDVEPEIVRRFYADACAAARTKDPRTPCVVGPAPFYNVRLARLEPEMLVRHRKRQ